TLGKISRHFAESHLLSPEMEQELRNIRYTSQDEVSLVAESMQQLTHTVLKRAAALEKQTDRLTESEERFRALTHSLADAILVYDEYGTIHFCNQVSALLFGREEAHLLNQPVYFLFAERWLDPAWSEKLLLTADKEGSVREGLARRGDDTEFPVEISLSRWQRKKKEFHTAVVRDISAHRLLEARDMRAYVNRVAISALLEIGLEPLPLRRKLEVALEIILTVPWLAVQYKGSIFLAQEDNTMMMVVQKGLHPHLLKACHRIGPGFCLCGKAFETREIIFKNGLDEQHDVTFDGISEHGHYCVPILLREQLLGVLNLYVDFGHPHDPEEEAFLSTIAVTLAGVIDRGLVEDRVHHLATHDQLTGLPNRMLFRELLEQEIRRATRSNQTLAVGFMDLDRFKEVNDTLGHEAGDILLKAVAQRSKDCLRDSDILARMGGDEFTLILPGVAHPAHLGQLATKVIQVLNEPFPIHGSECRIGASIGLVLFPEHGHTVDGLLQKADQAMYEVKRRGRNQYIIYQPDDEKPT
ncbi:MAG: diguanylate cyclase, partial [Magnetococcales bacterium]|nr:diguanylate cyclase [Magnetococcales bacterium]